MNGAFKRFSVLIILLIFFSNIAFSMSDTASHNMLILEEQRKEKRRIFEWSVLFGMMAMLAISSWILDKKKAGEIQAEITRVRLINSARAKIHNIKSNYNSINLLLLNGEAAKAQRYVTESANYLQFSLNSWKKRAWSLLDEIRLLERYYQAEKTYRADVAVKIALEDLDPREINFMPEVFTGLLDNSMKAFERKEIIEEEWKFSIQIKKVRKYLVVTVTDNGEGSSIDAFLKKENYDRGLNILNARLQNAWNGRFGETNSVLIEIESDRQIGTTIKFKYPYGKVESISS